jgi:hypothetical protein
MVQLVNNYNNKKMKKKLIKIVDQIWKKTKFQLMINKKY